MFALIEVRPLNPNRPVRMGFIEIEGDLEFLEVNANREILLKVYDPEIIERFRLERMDVYSIVDIQRVYRMTTAREIAFVYDGAAYIPCREIYVTVSNRTVISEVVVLGDLMNLDNLNFVECMHNKN